MINQSLPRGLVIKQYLLVKLNTVDTVKMAVETDIFCFPVSPITLELVPDLVDVFPWFTAMDSRES